MQKFFVVGRTIRRTDLYCYKHGLRVQVSSRQHAGKIQTRAFLWR